MNHLDEIADQIRIVFDAQNAARDKALAQARTLTRHCAHAIRAVHRQEADKVQQELAAAKEIADSFQGELREFPNLYFAGYTQDALKEYAEANIVASLIGSGKLPGPGDLNLEVATYLKGLAEVVGELRRKCMDILKNGHSDEAEDLLKYMDDIYSVLVTMDYPDAVTHGLRRLTDICRGILERTRGDIMTSFRQNRLEESLQRFEINLKDSNPKN